MRIVTWNCQGGFASKHAALRQLDPDIAVISEATEASLEAFGQGAVSTVWRGDNGKKGIAIVSFNGWQLTLSQLDAAERWFIPTIARKNEVIIQVIGVWVKQDIDYVGPTLRAIKFL
jgi:hypothetical protein